MSDCNSVFAKCVEAVDVIRCSRNHVSLSGLAEKLGVSKREAWNILYYLVKAGAVKVSGTWKSAISITLRRGFNYRKFIKELLKILEKEPLVK